MHRLRQLLSRISRWLSTPPRQEPASAPSTSPRAETALNELFARARLAANAVAPTRTVRFIDHCGAIVWFNGLSPQDAQVRLLRLEDLGLEVLDVLDQTDLPRIPTWPVEYEDPQCFNERFVARDDPANYNLGTDETRLALIASGLSPGAVIQATSAGFTSPRISVH